MRLSVVANCIASIEKPGTISETQYGAVTNKIAAMTEKMTVIPRNNAQASRRKSSPLSVASSGTKTWVSEKLATMKISCGKAPDTKKASVAMPMPSRVTMYHGIRIASTALQMASAASVRPNLNKTGFCLSCGLQDLWSN